MTFGERLKELRDQKNITQEDFAAAIGFNRSTLANWETDRALPDILTCNKIADYFQVSVDYLLGRTDFKQPPTPSSLLEAGFKQLGWSLDPLGNGAYKVNLGNLTKEDLIFFEEYKQLTPEGQDVVKMMVKQLPKKD